MVELLLAIFLTLPHCTRMHLLAHAVLAYYSFADLSDGGVFCGGAACPAGDAVAAGDAGLAGAAVEPPGAACQTGDAVACPAGTAVAPSPRMDQFLLGSIMADFFAGQNLQDYPPAVSAAIRQHRAIDTFTDSHPLFKECCRMIAAAGAPRFSSGILADIFWGHQLALMWDELVSPLLVPHWEMAEGPRVLPVAGTPGIGLVLKGLVPPSTPAQSLPPRTAQPATPQPPTLADFASLIYTAMARTAALHSPAFERAARWISGYKFFEGIVRREGLQQSLDGLSRRLSGAQKLSGSLKILDAQGDSLLLALRDFWPQVVALARESALAESLALDLLPTGIAEDKA